MKTLSRLDLSFLFPTKDTLAPRIGLRTFLAAYAVLLIASPWGLSPLAPEARAQEVQLVLEEGLNGYTGTRDNTIYEESENTNGGGQRIFAGRTLGQLSALSRRALLRFDLSQIPPGSTINSVELRLTVEQTRDLTLSPMNLHRLLKDWGEGTGDPGTREGRGTAPDQGDATWISNFHNISTWDSPGGDFAAGNSASTDVGVAGNTAIWTGSGLESNVQVWVDNPASNFGWILIGEESDIQSARAFTSSEGTGQRPRLTINYVPPAEDTPTPTPTLPGPTNTPTMSPSATPTLTPTPPGPTPTPAPEPADLDGNGVIDGKDLYLFMQRWDQTEISDPADLDGNNAIDAGDLFLFVRRWLEANGI